MFRRAIIHSTSVIIRRFSSKKTPPPGFEKFFKNRENTEVSKPPNFSLSKEENKELEDKAASSGVPKIPIKSESPTNSDSTKPSPQPQETKSSKSSEPEYNDKDYVFKNSQQKEETNKDDEKKHQSHDHHKKNHNQKPPFEFPKTPYPYIGVASLICLYYMIPEPQYKIITYQEMLTNYLHKGRVSKILIQTPESNGLGLCVIQLQNSAKEPLAVLKLPDASAFVASLQSEQLKLGKTPEQFIEIENSVLPKPQSEQTTAIATALFTLLVLGGTFWYIKAHFPRGNAIYIDLDEFLSNLSIAKKTSQKYAANKPKITFKDVAGLGKAKQEIAEFVQFLKFPEKFKKLGARMPRGALLVGPPGTGKTLLAKASAGEAGVPFFSVSGSEFVEMYVGLGASRVRDLFEKARQQAPSIIFIDEIDAVGGKRDSGRFRNDERDTTLNQLLVEMDGFSTDASVIVMAATNRQDILDSALLRPGRFDRIVEIGLPDIEGRKEIMKVHLSPLSLALEFDRERCAAGVAALTPGFSGADLSQLCNEAAILAARLSRQFVAREDFENAIEKVIMGVETSKRLNPREKRIVAYHEAGHAVTGWFLEGADPVLKVSILPRSKGALGFAQSMPRETPLYSEAELLDKISTILGGRVAEQVFFNSVTNGAADDLKKATGLAVNLVENFGMSGGVGLTSYNANERGSSEHTQGIIDLEVRKIIDKCREKAREVICERKEMVVKLAERLIEKEGVGYSDLVEILGVRSFEQSEEYRKFISG